MYSVGWEGILSCLSLAISKQHLMLHMPLVDVIIANLYHPLTNNLGRLLRFHSSKGYFAMMGRSCR